MMTFRVLPVTFGTLLLAACSGSLEDDPSQFVAPQGTTTTTGATATTGMAGGSAGGTTGAGTTMAGGAGVTGVTATGGAMTDTTATGATTAGGAPTATGTTAMGTAGAATAGTTTTAGAGGAVTTVTATSTAPPEIQAVMALAPNVANGATAYDGAGCNVCHGAMGEGVTGLGADFRLNAPMMTEEQIATIIYNGDPDNALMSPFGGTITDQEVRDLAAYIKTSWGM